jgi:hypothetical protein
MARPREAQGEHLTMGGAGEEHLTIDLGKTASIVGGVTRAPGSPNAVQRHRPELGAWPPAT